MPLDIGDMIGERYRVVKLLGQGGMGAVYRAWDTRLDRPVALKEMTPQSGLDADTLAQLRRQFQQEAQILAGLDHTSPVRVTDYSALIECQDGKTSGRYPVGEEFTTKAATYYWNIVVARSVEEGWERLSENSEIRAFIVKPGKPKAVPVPRD